MVVMLVESRMETVRWKQSPWKVILALVHRLMVEGRRPCVDPQSYRMHLFFV